MLALGVAAVVATALAPQQTAQQVLATQHERQQQRWSTVENYSTVLTTEEGAMNVPIYRERIGSAGQYSFRIVPPAEWLGEEGMAAGRGMAAGMAQGLRMLGPALTAQLPLSQGGEWMAMNALGSATLFLDSAAAYRASNGRADAAAARAGMAAFAVHARLAGRETIGGRPAFHLVADNLSGIDLPGTDGSFRPSEAHLWVDAEHYVQLRLSVSGEVTLEGEPTQVTIEETRTYAASDPLYEPTLRHQRITGLISSETMTPEERRDLEKAQREVAEMKAQMEANQAQLAQLPEAQRNMIMNRLNKAIAQLEAMSSGGTLEMFTRERITDINAGPPLNYAWPGGGQ